MLMDQAIRQACAEAAAQGACTVSISHNEIEDALPEHIVAGANVLLQAMLDLSNTQVSN
jgi:hypothetical protein